MNYKIDHAVVTLVKELEPEETAHVLKTADDVVKHQFLFDMEWDMERTYEPVCFGDKIDWGYNPGDDSEFTWQFNRHRFLICLGQAYQITGEEAYVACALDLMEQFMDSENEIERKRQTTWRILEVGIRAANWIKAIALIQESPLVTQDKLSRIYDFLDCHARLIEDEHYPYCYAGNWGMLENHGLYLLGALMKNENSAHYRQQALSVIETGLNMQILPDGMQLEQSPMYHHEVLVCMLEVVFFARLCGDIVPETILEQIHRMMRAAISLQKPNGHQLTMGDSDDMNPQGIYALAAYLFNDPVYKWAALDAPGFDNLWLWGSDGYNRYKQIPSQKPDWTTVQLYDSGHTILRSSWNEDADMLHFDGGLLGTSHGHSDTLHVDLILDGRDVLIDPGRYTYVTKPERFAFKGTAAHNTIMVDGKDFDEWNHSWISKTVSAQSRQLLVQKQDCNFVSAGHTGYMTLDNPVWLNRKVIQVSDDIYILADECYTSGEHAYTQFFHYDYQGQLSLHEHRARFITGNTVTDFYFDEKGESRITDTKQSLHYNQQMDNKSIECHYHAKGFYSMNTVIIKNPQDNDQVVTMPVKSFINQEVQEADIADGLRIVHGEKAYSVIIGHTEMKAPVTLYQIGDYMGCGNIIVFDEHKGNYEGVVLNY